MDLQKKIKTVKSDLPFRKFQDWRQESKTSCDTGYWEQNS